MKSGQSVWLMTWHHLIQQDCAVRKCSKWVGCKLAPTAGVTSATSVVTWEMEEWHMSFLEFSSTQ